MGNWGGGNSPTAASREKNEAMKKMSDKKNVGMLTQNSMNTAVNIMQMEMTAAQAFGFDPPEWAKDPADIEAKAWELYGEVLGIHLKNFPEGELGQAVAQTAGATKGAPITTPAPSGDPGAVKYTFGANEGYTFRQVHEGYTHHERGKVKPNPGYAEWVMGNAREDAVRQQAEAWLKSIAVPG